ncbi:MAG: class II fumarate hydratase [Chromatiales bacterium]|jgi:fumarate hydratase class II
MTQHTEQPDPSICLYGEQTRLALENFNISGQPFPPAFIHALGLIKSCAAQVNAGLGLLRPDMADAIADAADQVAAGRHDEQFPLDVFQTGSGTSTNMNANEVIATLAARSLGREVHANDDVNLGQSSNDVIPTAMHVSAVLQLGPLVKALQQLEAAILIRAEQFGKTVKTGRTHLMDAVPITLGQELSGWAAQLAANLARLSEVQQRLLLLAQGGTAVGTGLNTHADFATRFAACMAERTGLAFRSAPNKFAAISSQDTAVELSGQLRVTALSLLKMATDLRWMNSGPTAGLHELQLPEMQAGSSIMPGKVNPVIPEAVGMACVQVIGLDAAIVTAAQDNRFQLMTMLPLLANNLLQQIGLLNAAAQSLQTRVIARFEVDQEKLLERVRHNTMLVTALSPHIGYDLAAQIAHAAIGQQRPVIDVAREMTALSDDELKLLLDPGRMARPHSEG